LGDLDGATSDFNKAIEMDSRDYEAYVNRGLVLMMQSRNPEAERDFNYALKLAGHSRPIVEERVNKIKRRLELLR
jgi:Flp pilus assembly protein TadD